MESCRMKRIANAPADVVEKERGRLVEYGDTQRVCAIARRISQSHKAESGGGRGYYSRFLFCNEKEEGYSGRMATIITLYGHWQPN